MENILLSEQQKYRELWKNNDYRSGNAISFAGKVSLIIKHELPKLWHSVDILDIGCGDGTTINELNGKGHNYVHGLDIVTDQVKVKKLATSIYEAPAWDIPEKNRAFDYTISTDVLEHIPPDLVTKTIYEIIRATGYHTIHAIYPLRDKWHPGAHLSIKPIEWWQEQFNRANDKRIKITLFDAATFNIEQL